MHEPAPLETTAATTGTPPLELADAVEAVRGQLMEAMARGAGQRVQFAIEDIEIEFAVTFSHDRKIDGGIRVWVLNAGGSAGTSISGANRVKVSLKASDTATGETVKILDAIDPGRSR